MGLLDNLDDPKTQALLSLGFGLLNSRGNFGQGLGQAGAQAMGTFADAKKAQQQKAMQEQQMQAQALQQQMMQQQLSEAQRAAADRQRQQEFLQGLPSPQMQASGQAMAGGGGPTQAAAGRIAPVDPMQQLMFQGVKAGAVPLQTYMQSMQKDEAPIVKPMDSDLVTRSGKVLLAGKPKDEAKPELAKLIALRDSLPPGHPDRSVVSSAIMKVTTHAPGTSVNVNTDNLGLKPKDKFEMEQKLSSDYGGATKMDRGIVSTAQDIAGILKQGGSLKDQAAIYKFAKALDPDGAVREADYSAIVRTVGGLDYVKALVTKAMTGEQLLPKQRQEMITLVNSMADVAKRRIGASQRRYGANAKLYNLNPDNVFADADNEGWSITPAEGK